MDVPETLRYSKDHEWLRTEDGEAVVGITAYAADELGDVVFVELPEVGRSAGARTRPSASSSRSRPPATCTRPSPARSSPSTRPSADEPELVNSEPYEGGWMVRLRARRRGCRRRAAWTPPPIERLIGG